MQRNSKNNINNFNNALAEKLSMQEINHINKMVQDDNGHSFVKTVAQIYTTQKVSGKWNKCETGVLTFVEDNKKKTYLFRLYDLDKGKIWEHEMYLPFKYQKLNEWFHMFNSEGYQIGINFACENEANLFFTKVTEIAFKSFSEHKIHIYLSDSFKSKIIYNYLNQRKADITLENILITIDLLEKKNEFVEKPAINDDKSAFDLTQPVPNYKPPKPESNKTKSSFPIFSAPLQSSPPLPLSTIPISQPSSSSDKHQPNKNNNNNNYHKPLSVPLNPPPPLPLSTPSLPQPSSSSDIQQPNKKKNNNNYYKPLSIPLNPPPPPPPSLPSNIKSQILNNEPNNFKAQNVLSTDKQPKLMNMLNNNQPIHPSKQFNYENPLKKVVNPVNNNENNNNNTMENMFELIKNKNYNLKPSTRNNEEDNFK